MSDTIAIQIDVPENNRLYEQVASLIQRNFQTLVDKNESYGDIRSSAQLLSELDVYGSSTEAFAHRGFSRLTEKHSRYAKLQFTDHESRIPNEDKADTCLDAANYWLWQAWLHEYGSIEESPVSNSPWVNKDDMEYDFDSAIDDMYADVNWNDVDDLDASSVNDEKMQAADDPSNHQKGENDCEKERRPNAKVHDPNDVMDDHFHEGYTTFPDEGGD